MTHTVIRLSDLPPDLHARAKSLGRMQGPHRLVIESHALASLLSHHTGTKPVSMPPMDFGVQLRSELDQALLLTICEACDRNKGGRCSLCRSCGGGIPVKDWVKLEHHHCPDKKW